MGDVFYLCPAGDAPAKHPPVVRICGRPSTSESASFNIDANHWISFANKKAPFAWSGTIPEGWAHKPILNPNGPRFVSVSGILAGIKTEESPKRFHADITLVAFLGPAPPVYAVQLTRRKRKAGINFNDLHTPTKKHHE